MKHLLIIFFTTALLFSCKKEEISIAGYDCYSGTCERVSKDGIYTSLSDYQKNCISTGSAGYICSGGDCYSVSSGASYSTLSSAKAAVEVAEAVIFQL